MLHARNREARISAKSGHEGIPQTRGPPCPHVGLALKGKMSTSVHDVGLSKGSEWQVNSAADEW